jgi:hypothetical protein
MALAHGIDPPTDSNAELGTLIRQARERAGIRQVDLAAAIHVGLSTVASRVRGACGPGGGRRRHCGGDAGGPGPARLAPGRVRRREGPPLQSTGAFVLRGGSDEAVEATLL